ncbi:hypothetical protein B0H67DRAFT_493921, partial [Lasiosphaeris hirsuta]
GAKTYNTRYSLVVSDPTTSPALTGLSMGERTGSRVFPQVLLLCTKYAECGSSENRTPFLASADPPFSTSLSTLHPSNSFPTHPASSATMPTSVESTQDNDPPTVRFTNVQDLSST